MRPSCPSPPHVRAVRQQGRDGASVAPLGGAVQWGVTTIVLRYNVRAESKTLDDSVGAAMAGGEVQRRAST